ncbi:DUF3422 domain-containing protein [Rhizobium sp. 25PS6]|uniref:DUF3422 family protein n=2 Tax=Rhizobium TaxID=379 RepID=A0A3S0SMC2_9HYPH|nr:MULTISPECIES: DUF3422 domain-containing protein [Rhizobium]MBA1345322.1 DUF3422 domain-containing protein [Rhizobium sp. WYCCWR 11146]MDR9764338.1 DUF3422 domain-containing protein [Rhizobium redzepovicii]MDR9785450.1 DUF3422 domain-containing protein [Rhizobium redzepovicii]MDU0364769.1 DUF3422 domain-containing protein [Rhizobium sp. 25PS6]NNU63719.1 DUF3422 domain-containing protein [Rhizobium sp. WYCCWR 11152]
MLTGETDQPTAADFTAELHARPSIYFAGPALVEHFALMPAQSPARQTGGSISLGKHDTDLIKTRVEYHTEFVTVTRVTMLDHEPEQWPAPTLVTSDILAMLGLPSASIIGQVSILVMGPAPDELGDFLPKFGFDVSAASMIGGGAGQVCSDFRVRSNGWSHTLLFNKDLNAYRLGRMVRRIYEVETYRSMALLGLPLARRLAPRLAEFDARLGELADRNQSTPADQHKNLLNEISELSAAIITASAETRSRFGATAAYAKIVEERISELRETHVPGFQRFGVFITRRFKPAVRTCEAAAHRLEQLSGATLHLLNLLQTRIQVEVEFHNAIQIRSVAERAATQVKIQRAVEGFSIIAISYYLVGLIKTAFEACQHAGWELSPLLMLGSLPLVFVTVTATVLRVKRALATHE